MLNDKSLTELRTIANGLGIKDIFSKSPAVLIHDIEVKHSALIPKEKIIVPIEYRLISSTDMCDKDELLELLEPYIQRGLKVFIGDETWRFSFGNKNDSGTLRMPYKIALKKAAEVLA